MTSIKSIADGPESAPATIVLAHGAGAPMDTPFMDFFAQGLGALGWSLRRFEFPYMAARREDGRKRPPDRQEKLFESWRAAVSDIPPETLVIGGKSLGGRMASMLAEELRARACLCLGYPFHPAGKPERLRIAHLEEISVPTLILQGSRDPLGTRDEVETYPLGPRVRLHWAEDGNHDLQPRKLSGRSKQQNWQEALAAIDAFLRQNI